MEMLAWNCSAATQQETDAGFNRKGWRIFTDLYGFGAGFEIACKGGNPAPAGVCTGMVFAL